MTGAGRIFGAAALLLLVCLCLNLAIGDTIYGPRAVAEAVVTFDPYDLDHAILRWQRAPRALIAAFAGALAACGGAVLQGLTRNPLASPGLLGLNAGAALFVIAGAFLLNLSEAWRGPLAVCGAAAGLAAALTATRLVGARGDPRGVGLILGGAIISMFFIALTNALMLLDPVRRSAYLGWALGNVDHSALKALAHIWPIGALGLATLLAIARPLTLLTLGADKAASAGVAVGPLRLLALAAVALMAGAATAVCGPLAFLGLAAPHLARPFAGDHFARALPLNAMTGAGLCLLADAAARAAFAPYVLHTGVMLDLLGGAALITLVRRYCLATARP